VPGINPMDAVYRRGIRTLGSLLARSPHKACWIQRDLMLELSANSFHVVTQANSRSLLLLKENSLTIEALRRVWLHSKSNPVYDLQDSGHCMPGLCQSHIDLAGRMLL
jgi:hypothetical protein